MNADGPARMLRLLLLALVAVGLAPGTFVRTPVGLRSDVATVSITPVADTRGTAGALRLTGVWELRSRHGWFGGFSALVAGNRGSALAASDRGWLLDLDLSGDRPRAVPGSFRPVNNRSRGRKEVVDLESLARDPATGTVWGAFENDNLITRFTIDGTRRTRAPAEMARWSINSGPETFTRLGDGRFLIIAEGTMAGSVTAHDALLFARDPVEAGKPLRFRFIAPEGFDPVDATALPDGRVMILLRRYALAIPPPFDTAIAIADPRAIRAGANWRVRVIQRLTGGALADNFEGLAYAASPQDPARGSLWLISDNNFSIFQRSLLVRFDWDADTVAMGR